jgi:hypothetical protein
MKKVYVSPLQEILDTHITQVQDYLEDALQVVFQNYLESTSGVIHGLAPTAGTGLVLNIASGAIILDGIYGELESATGITLQGSAVSGAFRTDLIVASYEEVLEDYASGYILLDTSTRTETITSLPGSRVGRIKIEQLTNTNYSTRPANKIPICQVIVSYNQITVVTDYRIFSTIERFKKELQLSFSGLFYGSMY